MKKSQCNWCNMRNTSLARKKCFQASSIFCAAFRSREPVVVNSLADIWMTAVRNQLCFFCALRLQQRAKTKITFPLVWTNTCLILNPQESKRKTFEINKTLVWTVQMPGCSHPLYGMKPCEVDMPGSCWCGNRLATCTSFNHEISKARCHCGWWSKRCEGTCIKIHLPCLFFGILYTPKRTRERIQNYIFTEQAAAVRKLGHELGIPAVRNSGTKVSTWTFATTTLL